jgi:hypothetical protein
MSTRVYKGVVELYFQWSLQSEEDDSVSVTCELSYKGPINSVMKSKTRLISNANPGYVTIFIDRTLGAVQVAMPIFSVYVKKICKTRLSVSPCFSINHSRAHQTGNQ